VTPSSARSSSTTCESRKANVLGELNQGWPLAMHTLTNERGPAVAGRQVKLRVVLDRLVDEARSLQRDGRPVSRTLRSSPNSLVPRWS